MIKQGIRHLMAWCIALYFVFCSIGCNESLDNIDKTITAEEIAIKTILSQAEYDKIADTINDNFPNDIDYNLSYVAYNQYADAFNKSFSVGYKGLPVLIGEIEKNYNDDSSSVPVLYGEWSVTIHYYYEVFSVLARIPYIHELSDCYKGDIKKDIVNIRTEISTNINSTLLVEDKISTLRTFGVLAIPAVLSELEKGNAAFENFFVAAGLHLSDQKYAELVDVYSQQYNPNIINSDEFMDGAEDFDYKVWLEENEEDLDNLFKFLDAYCAEYEAEK